MWTDLPDLLQGLGDVLVGVTVRQDALMTGPGCTLQGFLINSGDISSAIWSFIIALHSFTLLVGSPKLRGWAADKTTSGKARWIICAGVWIFVFGIGTLGPVVFQNLHPENGPYCIIPNFSSLMKIPKSVRGDAGSPASTTGRDSPFITVRSKGGFTDCQFSCLLICLR
jgi:hypothetical protein